MVDFKRASSGGSKTSICNGIQKHIDRFSTEQACSRKDFIASVSM